MKTLEELNSLLTDLPCPFAVNADWDDDSPKDFPTHADSSATNYETGIPQIYATGKTDGGRLIPRADFNRLGDLATRELFLRRCGFRHTFSTDFSGENAGYAEDALLAYDDGKWLRAVESQETENDLDFVEAPRVIDNLALKPSDDPATAEPRILWKTANNVYGFAEGLAHVGVDYSRRQDLSSGNSLANDSLVIVGTNAWELGTWGTESDIAVASILYPADWSGAVRSSVCGEFAVELYIGDVPLGFPCKGLQGGSFSPVLLAQVKILGELMVREYYNRICGGASFPLAFYATKGTKISWVVKGGPGMNPIPDDRVSAIAYPLETSVAKGGAE